MPRTYSNDDTYMMYTYKVKLCTRTDSHSWKHCPWRHPGESAAQRRHPSMHRPVMCMNLRLAGDCADGDSCPFSHNAFELSLHPERYKTTLCNLGEKCARDICFFAHSEKDLRTAEPAAPPTGGGQGAGSSAHAGGGPVWGSGSSSSQAASLSAAGPSAGGVHSSGMSIQQQQQPMVAYTIPQMAQQQQQQQQQPMLVYTPQSMRQGPAMPQLLQPQQQQVVVLQAPQFIHQPQGVWVSQQQLQQVPDPQPMQHAGMVPAALQAGMHVHSAGLAAAAQSAELSSSSYLLPVASGAGGGSGGNFMPGAFAGSCISSASAPMEQQQLQDHALMMRQDLCKFDSFTSQGAAAGGFSMGTTQQQVLLQQLQQQQQQPVARNVTSLDTYLGQMSLAGVQQRQSPGVLVQQDAAMFSSFTSQGGSSGHTEFQSGVQQQQQYALQRHVISNLDSFTSQCSMSAGSFSSSGPTYASAQQPQQQQQQQQQVLFSAAYSDPSYYYEQGQAEGAEAVNMTGSQEQVLLPMHVAFDAQSGAMLPGQPSVQQLPGAVLQAPLPGYGAAAAAGQTVVALPQGDAGVAAGMSMVEGAGVGVGAGRASLDVSAALVPQQQVAAQTQQQQRQAGMGQLQQFPRLQ